MSSKGAVATGKKLLLNIKSLVPFLIRLVKREEPVNSKLVFVLSFPRSGTHAIGSLLSNESAGFKYYGEFFIFNAWQKTIEQINHYYPFFSFRYHLNLKQQRKAWEYDKFEKTTLNAFKTLREIKRIPGSHVIKIFPQHLSDPLLQALIAEFKPHIIFLRRNHLDRFVSHKKANASGKWHTAPSSDLVITLDPEEFNTYIEKYTDFYRRYATYAPSVGCKTLDVGFDDLRDPVKVREIQKFAALDGFQDWDILESAPTTVKQDKSSKVQDDFLAQIGKKRSDFDFPKVG